MSIQDRLERILRDLLVMVSKAPTSNVDGDYVLVHKKAMQQQLGYLRDVVQEMMNQYEATEESRNRGTLEVQKQREQIIRNANHQAQDIYAASVLYTEEALEKIQDIITEAEQASKKAMDRLKRDMEEERRRVRSNQNELLIQLEDLKDTAKYMRLIEDRNREIAKAKAKKEENLKPRRYNRKSAATNVSNSEEQTEDTGTEEKFKPIRPEIRVNEEYLRKLGYMQDEPLDETPEADYGNTPEKVPANVSDETFMDLAEDRSEEIAAEIIAEIAREISEGIPEGQTGKTSAAKPAGSGGGKGSPAATQPKPPGRRKKKRLKNAQKQYGNMKEISVEDISVPEEKEEKADTFFSVDDDDDKIVYEKPVIKVNPDYFEKLKKQNQAKQNDSAKEEPPSEDAAENRGKRQGFFPFGRKS